MTPTTTPHVLDNTGWHALNSHFAPFSSGTRLAKRFRPEFLALAGVVDHSDAALRDLNQIIDEGETVYMVGAVLPELPGWSVHDLAIVDQMVAVEPPPEADRSVDIVQLSATDVPEIAALVDLTKPGPFFPQFLDLGRFFGIRQDGALVALAGERFYLTGYHEISTVCTHPDYQGRGYAGALVSFIANDHWRQGDVPFLHVFPTNSRAIRVYESLNFRLRRQVQIAGMTREPITRKA
jgi:predicted GNAT family acetyltransferase